MARPYTMSVIEDIPISSVRSILRDQRGRSVTEPSRVQIYANRETTAITYNILIGADSALEDGVAAIQATDGQGPVIPDDLLVDSFADTGDEIVVRARNSDAAAAREARVLIRITPIGDIIPGGS